MPMIENELIYDERYCEYRLLYEGLEFCWDEKPSGDYLDTVKVLAQNYQKILIRLQLSCSKIFEKCMVNLLL